MPLTVQQGMRSQLDIKMTDREFKTLSKLITEISGIKLPQTKKLMLEARLRKRLRHLKMWSFKEYIDYLFKQNGLEHELVPLLNVVTTNKTDFFREPVHFDYLIKTALPELLRYKNKLHLWSAGCSSGEEPYTLAMVLSEYQLKGNEFSFSILGTDLSVDVLQKARNAVYKDTLIQDVPLAFRRRYFLKSKNRSAGLVRLIPEIREKITWGRLNLLDNAYKLKTKQDVIFCRNVFIYFDKTIQEQIVNRFYQCSNPGAYLFIGHSENLHGLDVPYKQVAPTIYRRG